MNIGQIFEQTVQENSGQGGQVENQEQKQEQQTGDDADSPAYQVRPPTLRNYNSTSHGSTSIGARPNTTNDQQKGHVNKQEFDYAGGPAQPGEMASPAQNKSNGKLNGDLDKEPVLLTSSQRAQAALRMITEKSDPSQGSSSRKWRTRNAGSSQRSANLLQDKQRAQANRLISTQQQQRSRNMTNTAVSNANGRGKQSAEDRDEGGGDHDWLPTDAFHAGMGARLSNQSQ